MLHVCVVCSRVPVSVNSFPELCQVNKVLIRFFIIIIIILCHLTVNHTVIAVWFSSTFDYFITKTLALRVEELEIINLVA